MFCSRSPIGSIVHTHCLHCGHDGGDDEHGREDDHDSVGEVVDVEVVRDPPAHHQQDGLEWVEEI